jgi:hypothetical protein
MEFIFYIIACAEIQKFCVILGAWVLKIMACNIRSGTQGLNQSLLSLAKYNVIIFNSTLFM